MHYIQKSAHTLNGSWNFEYLKPVICPYCGIGTDCVVSNSILWPLNPKSSIFVAVGKCTACGKSFLFSSEIEDGCVGNFATMYPQKHISFQSEIIKGTSERFVTLYNQALDAEQRGDIDIASFGYRSALEILVKDYAIYELKKPREEVVNKKLFDAISLYLGEESLIKSADVIRILGNDYAHYERKYPECDFNVLKKYMEIFINLVETKLMISHPPVARPEAK